MEKGVSPTAPLSVRERLKQTWGKYEKYAPAAFFVGGFLFDVLTLDRIDNTFAILQQGAFLAVIGILLSLNLFDEQTPIRVPSWLGKVWDFRTEILHFLFGGLLSAFFLFFFRSSSLASSFVFLLLISALLVINEFPRFQRLGSPIKFALFAVCVISYLSYLIPIATGFIGFWPLVLVVISSGAVIGAISWAYTKMGLDRRVLQKNVLRPTLMVMVVYLALYFFKLIPPVPLSIQYIGIYHDVRRLPQGQYQLFHERPWWRFWHHGDQVFRARPGDRIHCFVRIFSPTNFQDKVFVHWLRKDPERGWESRDRIPFQIRGGRDEGFRGSVFKGNYEPGRWRVQVETRDGHEIGRIGFEVEAVEASPLEVRVDTF